MLEENPIIIGGIDKVKCYKIFLKEKYARPKVYNGQHQNVSGHALSIFFEKNMDQAKGQIRKK
jgi:hypothetical protein